MTHEQLKPHDQTPQETSPKKEILSPIPNIITISGYSGVGKTSVARILKAMLHMGFEKVGGEKFRAWYEKTTGQKVLGFADRDPSVDKALDDYTSSRIAQAIKTGRKVIVEARLGGWLAKKTEDKLTSQREPGEEKPRQTFRILLRASEGIRFSRIRNREGQTLSFNQVEKQTKEREKKDLAIWQIAHPELRNIDPLSEVNRDEHGEPIYDLIVNTDFLSVAQVAEKIYRELKARNLLMNPQPPLLPQGTIFRTP